MFRALICFIFGHSKIRYHTYNYNRPRGYECEERCARCGFDFNANKWGIDNPGCVFLGWEPFDKRKGKIVPVTYNPHLLEILKNKDFWLVPDWILSALEDGCNHAKERPCHVDHEEDYAKK